MTNNNFLKTQIFGGFFKVGVEFVGKNEFLEYLFLEIYYQKYVQKYYNNWELSYSHKFKTTKQLTFLILQV